VKNLYNRQEISRLCGVSAAQVRYWQKVGLIVPVEIGPGEVRFDFRGLAAFRAVKKLRDQGIPLHTVRHCLRKLNALLPQVEQPLCQVRLECRGRQVLILKDKLKQTPEGQLVLDFSDAAAPSWPLPVSDTDRLFFQALELQADGDWDRAAWKYQSLLQLQGEVADVLVNLGACYFQQKDHDGAEGLFRRALQQEPDHVEASFNLANLLAARGELETAVGFYSRALAADPECTAAHFNLARVLDRLGRKQAAMACWRAYLELEPHSIFAAEIRCRIKAWEDEPGPD
jgi:tetratricopeptide (TPR) repeat protein